MHPKCISDGHAQLIADADGHSVLLTDGHAYRHGESLTNEISDIDGHPKLHTDGNALNHIYWHAFLF